MKGRHRRTRGETYRLERQMVAMMLQFPEMIADIERRRTHGTFHGPVAGGDRAGHPRPLYPWPERYRRFWWSRWDDPEKKAVVARLSLTDEHWDRDGCMNLINQFAASIRRRDKALLKRIAAAEKSGDVDLLASLLREKQHQAQRTMKNKRHMNH
jgi:DNA primase